MPTTRVKLQTFVLSGALAGLAGALYVLALAPAAPARARSRPAMSIEVFSYSVIGGLGSDRRRDRPASLFFRVLDFVLAKTFSGDVVDDPPAQPLRRRPARRSSTSCPAACGSSCSACATATCRWVADRHDLLVPSLVADKRVDDDDGRRRTTITPTTRPASIAGALP